MTRENAAGMKWQDKFHPMGRISNQMNDLVYQPHWPPEPSSLDNPLPPLYRSEVVEALGEAPDRRLTWRDYYAVLQRRPTDAYEDTKFKAEWEARHPEMKAQCDAAWDEFLRGINAQG